MPCAKDYFYSNLSGVDGLFPYCKRCNIKNSAMWQHKNPERKNASNNKYNKKGIQMERHRKSEKRRRKNGLVKEWQRNNPEKIKQYRNNHNKHEINEEEWLACKEYFNNSYAYCGLPLTKHWVKFRCKMILGDFHKDHVDHNGNDKLSNCVPSCKKCNSSKWKFKFEDWYNKDNEIFSMDRYGKIIKWINEDHKNYDKIKEEF
jgi:hypothetical protein